ncbi:arginine deiminase-related protein [Roseivirga sp. UBA838]|uniref:citrulline utilization hydrolase CtlX n=1 Tax=Roseivirga sp. UBA838 TaxID=1947393 RepID=UPI00257DA936|nr:arginine deiminase-related protein [Roseivirga sp. UBA838]|tara:strand:- start:14695 stop:15603 length:909 start_codon:yes stop_codon:yes gene_type:complete
MKQAAAKIMMVRPAHFGYDPSTAETNSFQQTEGAEQQYAIQRQAVEEFNGAVATLRAAGIDVVVIDDTDEPKKPNAVFPNNWVSFHDGRVILYPMLAENRRWERRMDLLDELAEAGVPVKEVIDISKYEAEDKFLESTGSVVIDYENDLAYACLSSRTHKDVLNKLCELNGYEPVLFESFNKEGVPVYHTNVVMCIASKYAVICAESIREDQRFDVLQTLKTTGHEVVEITMDQMYGFAGNMLEVENQQGESVLVMSQTAYDSLTESQIQCLSAHSKIQTVQIPTIEKFGGGSVRCMMCRVL